MNFKKLMIAVAAVVLIIAVYEFATHVDRSNPVAVATGFTKALKAQDTSAASKFFPPDRAAAWRDSMDDKLQGMKTGATERFFERFPDKPTFGQPQTVAGKTIITTNDKGFALELTQIAGKWYVTGPEFQ